MQLEGNGAAGSSRDAWAGCKSRLDRFLAWDATRSLPALFLILGCPLGLLYAFLMAPLQVPDEIAHFYRAYSVSEGACVAPVQQTVPASLAQLQVEFPERVELVRRIRFQDYRLLLHPPSDQAEQRQIANAAANVYNCAPYLVSAAAIASARLVSLPPIVQMFGARLANLAFYLALVYVSLRILPGARLTLFCLALMPMTLHQAASVSADSPGFATTFLLFAYIAYLAFDAKLKVVTTRQWIFAMALLLFASLCKFNLWLVLLLLLIPSARVGTMKKKLATISAITGLLLLVSTLWQAVNRENLAAFALERNAHDIYPQDNFAFVVQQPLEFARALFRTWRILSLNYADNFVGTLGWLTISLPRWLVWSWVGMLLTTALAAAEVRLTAAQRAVCLVVAGGSALSVFLLLWTMQMRRADFVELGMNSGVIPGVQGRYFIPVAPVLLLAISSGRRRLKPSVAVTCCAAMVLLAAAVSLTLVWQAYY